MREFSLISLRGVNAQLFRFGQNCLLDLLIDSTSPAKHSRSRCHAHMSGFRNFSKPYFAFFGHTFFIPLLLSPIHFLEATVKPLTPDRDRFEEVDAPLKIEKICWTVKKIIRANLP